MTTTTLATMPTTWQGIVDLCDLRNTSTVTLGNNTTATHDAASDKVRIYLHGHHIVTLCIDGAVLVRHCGYITTTTFDRINRFLPRGYRATRRGGVATLHTPNGDTRGIYGDAWITTWGR